MSDGRDTPHPRRPGGPVRLSELPWRRLEHTGERYLDFSEFARLGFLARWNVFLGADGYQTPFIYPSRDFDAEPIGFDIVGHGINFTLPVVDPMVSSAFDNYQDFARPDFSPEERARIRRQRRIAEEQAARSRGER